MLLQSGVSAESIPRVHFKFYKVTIKMLSVLADVGRLRIALPLNARAVGIDQLIVEPFHDDFFVIGGIRAIKRGVRRGRCCLGG